jgi:hypothetical protein
MQDWDEAGGLDSSPSLGRTNTSQLARFRRASLLAAELAEDERPTSYATSPSGLKVVGIAALKRQSVSINAAQAASTEAAETAAIRPRVKRSESAFTSLRKASMAAVQSLNPLADRPLLNAAFDALEEEPAVAAPLDPPLPATAIEARRRRGTAEYAPLPAPEAVAADESDFFSGGWLATILPSSLTPATPKREPDVVATLRQVGLLRSTDLPARIRRRAGSCHVIRRAARCSRIRRGLACGSSKEASRCSSTWLCRTGAPRCPVDAPRRCNSHRGLLETRASLVANGTQCA